MDRQQLEHLNCIKAEIKVLTKEVENYPQGIVTDYYYDYPNGEKRVRPLIGLADCRHIKKRLQAQLEALEAEINAIEDYLETLEDIEMRAILRLRYRCNMKLEQIGDELGYDRSTIGKKLSEFWKDSHISHKKAL